MGDRDVHWLDELCEADKKIAELEAENAKLRDADAICRFLRGEFLRLEAENDKLRDLLRWRKWPDEKPGVGQHYLLMAGAKVPTVAEFTGEYFRFPSRIVDGVTHWRPIDPLPGGE